VLLTEMNCPLGRTAGNWLEVKEAVECLEGRGSADIMELVIDCATHLLVQSGKSGGMHDAFHQAKKCFASGAPRQKWDEMLVAQGADLEAFNRKLKQGDLAPSVKELKAREKKVVRFCDAKIVGEIVRDLGGGRLTKDSIVNHDVGIDRIAKQGEKVEKNGVLARVHAANEIEAEAALVRLEPAFRFSDQPAPTLLIHDVIR